jgi:hypothetical protein
LWWYFKNNRGDFLGSFAVNIGIADALRLSFGVLCSLLTQFLIEVEIIFGLKVNQWLLC